MAAHADYPHLLAPLSHPGLSAAHRVVMAPMTRFRADDEGVPLPGVARYYAQRAGAALIVTEGIWPSTRGQSDRHMPGLATAQQVDAWGAVTGAVHAEGGTIFAQLMHSGRSSHPDNRLDGSVPLAPSAVAPPGLLHVGATKRPYPIPRAMSYDDIAQAVDDHVRAARNAMSAGFDGVELHGANGYLIHQFLSDNTNLRDDAYGGSPAGRIAYPVEVTRAVVEAIGATRVGIRLSPGNPINGHVEADPGAVYRLLVSALSTLGLRYLHLTDNTRYPALADLRPFFSGLLIGNTGFGHTTTAEAGEALIRDGLADLVSFGRLYIANPDLPERLRGGSPLADYDERTLYTQTDTGYIDYPRASAVDPRSASVLMSA
ncbi:MAG TPA: alkene reductase [Mycobacteriales bacterium]|jgi:N-ethylmaleimide reductase